jgi:hypothetical protein
MKPVAWNRFHIWSALVATMVFVRAPLVQRGVPIPQQLVFTPYHASGIYNIAETVGWTVTPGAAPLTYAYKWTARRNNAVVLKEGTLDLSSGKDTIEITGDQPEMIYVAVEAYKQLTDSADGVPGDVPMIESEHDNLTPEKGRACPARTTEVLDTIVHGGQFTPKVLK